MANLNLIISARQRFLNEDGTVTPQWFRFLEALAQLVGGQFSTQDLALLAQSRQTSAGLATRADLDAVALLAAVQPQSANVRQSIDDATLVAWVKR